MVDQLFGKLEKIETKQLSYNPQDTLCISDPEFNRVEIKAPFEKAQRIKKLMVAMTN